MDLGKLVTKDKAVEGVWFQVELYGKKQPFEVKILGDDADRVRIYSREKLRGVKVEKDTTLEKAVVDELLDSGDEDCLVRLCGIRSLDKEPLMLGKTELKCDEASYKLVLEKIPALRDFILAKSRERTNFLS